MSAAEPAAKTIGNINGPWAVLFKIALVLIVPMLGSQGWLAWNVITINASRFTREDGKAVVMEMAQIRSDVARLPPRDLLDRMLTIELTQKSRLAAQADMLMAQKKMIDAMASLEKRVP